MNVKIVAIIVISFIVLPLTTSYIYGQDSSKTQFDTLPWGLITEKVHENSRFSKHAELCKSKQNKTADTLNLQSNYAYESNQVMIFKLPQDIKTDDLSPKITLHVAKYQDDSWQDAGILTTAIEPNEIKTIGGIEEEGFFRLDFDSRSRTGESKNVKFFVIVSNNWKKGFLAFCRELKRVVEANPDSELIRSSTAISHFDHTMELVSKASFLSDNILKALYNAVQSKKSFESGRYPDLIIGGLTKIKLKRFEGAKITEFVVFVPENYDSSSKWSLSLRPDPMRRYVTENYPIRSGSIDMWWHFPRYMGFDYKDYKYFLGVLKNKLNLDENRVFLYGDCANGVPTMALALRYPDQWAECSIILGNTSCHLAGNALNLPLIFVKGWHNEDGNIASYNFSVNSFLYYECRNFKHCTNRTVDEVRGKSIPDEVRKKAPRRILYTIESLGNPRAYWAKIEGRQDENFIARIDAIAQGQSILLKTENIDAYSLDLDTAPVDSNRSVEIIEDGKSLGFTTGSSFAKKSKKYQDAVYTKNGHLHGPVSDAFTDPYIVIWGTQGENKQIKTNEKMARSLANTGPCFADVNVPNELIDSHNLIIVGTLEDNIWLKRINKKLPVEIKNGRLFANGRTYEGVDLGLIFIYPNPLNLKRYVVVFSGTSQKAMVNIPKAYSQMKSMKAVDVGIFEVAENEAIKWHIIEKFNTIWGWHDQWNEVLIAAKKKHPKWQWHQWIARTLREQFEVDVVICKDPFKFSDSLPDGAITFRDICNTLENTWIIKLKLDGKNLKNLSKGLFSNIFDKDLATLVIDGIRATNSLQELNSEVLSVNELEDNKEYTVALPYKAINGERMGVVLSDYKIIGEGYLIPQWKDYLRKNKGLDIDVQLESFKFNVLF